MIQFNKTELRDKIHACWLGKNMGGTIGMPYENSKTTNDCQGFANKEGEPVPNDDLDLQLLWLKAITEHGLEGIDENVLAEYWLNYIPPYWNEYGVGKSNLRAGYFPPLSGEVNNEHWKHSNGAWIRTEIWATLFPGRPEMAIRYAYADACVDHGFGEGTYAAIFVAAMESAAFIFNDLNTLLDIGLSKIPQNCRVANCVRMVREGYAKGMDWKDVRQLLVDDSEDLGWLQAPANIGYVVLGLLYGEGDFKKSMLTAVRCGDDTDCTAATVGSLLYGHGWFPKTITQLTDCVMAMHPTTLMRHQFYSEYDDGIDVVISEGANDFGELKATDYYGTKFVEKKFNVAQYSFTARSTFFEVLMELDGKPDLLPGETLSGKVTVFIKNNPSQTHFNLRWFVPEGWQVAGHRHIYVPADWRDGTGNAGTAFAITAGPEPAGMTRVVLEVSTNDKPRCVYVPLCITG